MSLVTNVMIQFDGVDGDGGYDPGADPNDSDKMPLIQEIVKELTGSSQEFQDLCEARKNNWGGSKAPECQLFGGAFNYLDIDDFVRRLGELEWHRPEALRLFVQDQHEDAFGVWIILDGRLVRVVEPMEV